MQVYEGELGKEKGKGYRVVQAESLFDLLEAANNIDPLHRAKSDQRDRDTFNATESFADAYELGKSGWHDVRDKVDGYMQEIRQKLGEHLDLTSERVLDMIGSEPDIDRYLSGEMECMFDDMFIETPKNGKVFTLLVDASMTWDNSAESILKRGAALCGLVEAYMLLGYQLEVWTEITVKGDNDRRTDRRPYKKGAPNYVTFLARVNNAGDPIDIDSLMFAIGHPDYHRRIVWAVGEGDEQARPNFGYNSYGYYGLHRNGAHMQERVGASSVVSLDGNRAMEYNPTEWILEQLEIQGVWSND